MYEKAKVLKIYRQCNNKCPICNDIVFYQDVVNGNYVYSETRRRGKFLAHRKCIERILYYDANRVCKHL